jgi:hypothetical protein
MTQVSEITEQGYASQELPKQSRSAVLDFATTLLKNPGALKKFRVMGPDEERYVRPPREYEIPPFRESMRYCTSNEPYLRPTRWCNPREPEVIAMANELGAYKLSDYEFADAAYWFVKTKLVLEMLPLDSVSATLRRGTGTCYHLTSVWIALCRAAGIKARYKTFNLKFPEEISRRLEVEGREGGAMTVDIFDTGGRPEGEGEAYIDGKWVVAYVAMRPEIYAAAYFPIARFGEDAIGTMWELIPGTIERFESIPLRRGIAMKAFMWLAAAAMERFNVFFQTRLLPKGGSVIEEAGGIEAYERTARETLKRSFQTVELEDNEALVFGE